MKTVFLCLLLSLCLSVAFSDSLNPVNPDFDYPEQTQLNTSAADIPYKGEINTGYIQVNNETLSKIFYILYPANGADDSDATPDNDAPLILWLQGGPGCSDGTGNYQEIGPMTVVNKDGKLTPVLQDVTWNDKYNLLFVDNPVGVGFSVSGNEIPNNAMDAVRYLHVFLVRFFQLYPKLYKNDFYIFGESFAGHYIPALSSIIVQNNTENGINLKGLGVGDGWTDPYIQLGSFTAHPFATSLLDEKSRDHLLGLEILARQAIEAGDPSTASKHFDDITNFIGAIDDNVDIYNFDEYSPADPPYPDWLNNTSVKKAYGVDPNVTFMDCVDRTYLDFYPDIGTSYTGNYSYLLSQDVIPNLRIMLYSGQNDIICNTVGTYNYIKTFEWSGLDKFISSQETILKDSNGAVIGNYKNYNQFTFAVVYDAGHMVPQDQPGPARTLLEHFIKDDFSKRTETISK